VCELDRHGSEPRRFETGAIVGHAECSGDAADVATPLDPLRVGEMILSDDVADPDASARAQESVHLREHRRLVCRQVDHAVGDDDVD